MKKSEFCIVLLLTSIIVYLVTYIDTIGLHGDEAYLGLDGIEILKNGISKPNGLNHYTGILQALANSVSFRIWKIDISSLRLSGILFNILALLITIYVLKKRFGNNAVLIFLILFAQSIFLLCYSKVAWEVFSYNFLFIALSVFSIHKLENANQNSSRLYTFLFLFTTLLGSYNHIIFSSIIVATLSSLVMYVWFNQVKPSDFILKILSAAFVSLFNVVCLFLFMRSVVDDVWNKIGSMAFILPLILIIIEMILFKKITLLFEFLSKHLSKLYFSSEILKIIIPGIMMFFFLKIHFWKFFDILGNSILLIRLFSYPPSVFTAWCFGIAASAIILLTAYYLITDYFNKNTTVWTYFIIAYLGIFCIYTNKAAIRYFHILTILLFYYLSIKLIFNKGRIQLVLVGIILINIVVVQFTLWHLNINDHRKVKAMKFTIGKDNIETSAHFLNFSPVIDFAKKNKIGTINSEDDFFIGNVFKFYKQVYPEIQTYDDSVTVNYDYNILGSGFKIDSIRHTVTK
jgi:hypothetical protein